MRIFRSRVPRILSLSCGDFRLARGAYIFPPARAGARGEPQRSRLATVFGAQPDTYCTGYTHAALPGERERMGGTSGANARAESEI